MLFTNVIECVLDYCPLFLRALGIVLVHTMFCFYYRGRTLITSKILTFCANCLRQKSTFFVPNLIGFFKSVFCVLEQEIKETSTFFVERCVAKHGVGTNLYAQCTVRIRTFFMEIYSTSLHQFTAGLIYALDMYYTV